MFVSDSRAKIVLLLQERKPQILLCSHWCT